MESEDDVLDVPPDRFVAADDPLAFIVNRFQAFSVAANIRALHATADRDLDRETVQVKVIRFNDGRYRNQRIA